MHLILYILYNVVDIKYFEGIFNRGIESLMTGRIRQVDFFNYLNEDCKRSIREQEIITPILFCSESIPGFENHSIKKKDNFSIPDLATILGDGSKRIVCLLPILLTGLSISNDWRLIESYLQIILSLYCQREETLNIILKVQVL